MKKLGIYGGTFAPIHNGHINAARVFYDSLGLDELLVMPTYLPPHKQVNADDDPALRLEMAALAFKNEERSIKVSDYEIEKGGKSYTYLTLEHFASPDTEMYFLMGTDMFLTLDGWKYPERICELCTVVLVRREGDKSLDGEIEKAKKSYKYNYDTNIVEIDVPPIELSSTDIRGLIREGKDVSSCLPGSVLEFIKGNRLYSDYPLYSEIRRLVPKKRLRHIFGTEEEALRLSEIFGLDDGDKEKLRISALLHDITKYYTRDEHIAYLEGQGVSIDPDTLENEKTMHQLSGAFKAKELFPSLVDGTVFDAIRYHTTGRADMTLSEKLMYLADYIEPNRTFPDCVTLREYFYGRIESGEDKFKALCDTMIKSFEMTVNDLMNNGHPVHRDTTEAMEFLKRMKKMEEKKCFEPKELAEKIVKILDMRKGSNIKLLHVTEKTVLADYFVICGGNSNTQVKGLCDEVEYKLSLDGVTPTHIEGLDSALWALMDYSSVIVHIFNTETRSFYNLEKLWEDAEEVDISHLLTED